MVGDQCRCAAIGEPVLDGIDAEQLKQRHRDITRLVDGQMRDGRLRRLRQEYPHAVAALKPRASKRVGELVGERLEVIEGETCFRAFAGLVDEREAAGTVGPFIAGVDADVVLRGYLPRECRGKGFI